MNCKYNDCGWCYAPKQLKKNDNNGQCNKPMECEQIEVNALCLKSKTQLPLKLVEALKEIAEWDEQTLKTEIFENEHYIIKLENRLIVSVEEK